MSAIKDRLKEQLALMRLRRGDTEAFGFLYQTYIEKIYRFVQFKVADVSQSQDITQEIFTAAWGYVVDHKDVRNFKALLYRIALNKVNDFYREKGRQSSLLLDGVDEQSVSVNPSHASIELHFVRKALDTLKPEYQEVLTLRHLQGLSIKEIADVLDKDVNNIRVIVHRATIALKKIHPHNENREQDPLE